MDFGDILRKQEKTREAAGDQSNRAPKRQRTDDELPFNQSLGTALFEIWKAVRADAAVARSIDISKVEVEVRVGHIVAEFRRWKSQCSRKSICTLTDAQRAALGLNFRSGVDEIFVEHIKRVLTGDQFRMEQKPTQRMRSTDNGPRWEVDDKGNVLMVESKVKLTRSDLALISHQYDVRVNVATEVPEGKTSVQHPDKWTIERIKRRKTFKKEHCCWKVDLTEVDIKERSSSASSGHTAPSATGGREMELEFELEPEPTRRWLEEKDEGRAIERTKFFALQLEALLNLCIPGETENAGEAPMESLNPAKCSQEIIRINDTLRTAAISSSSSSSSRGGGGGVEFLGCMPINLSRRNLLNVQRNNYFITEKSDGTRYLLYVIEMINSTGKKELCAVIMNRAKAVWTLHGANILGAALGLGTVLDGELVYNLTLKETVFLVFDVLAVEGRACLQLPFSERQRIIRQEVMGRYSSYLARPSLPASTQKPTKLIRKNFVAKNQLRSELLSKIKLEDGERVYNDMEGRHHKSDGIIFQPDTPYTFSIDSDLLKWKWVEVRSVDLQVVINQVAETSSSRGSGGTQVKLMCGGPDGSLIDCSKRGRDHVGLGSFDTFRLLADIQDQPMGGNRGNANRIAEVVYDASIGLWGYLHLRKDKTDPNYIDTVIGVFMEQAEGINVEELQYRMLMKAESVDDWHAQITKMKLKLLDWQKNPAPAQAPSRPQAPSGSK